MILAIGSQNEFLHVYQNDGDLVAANIIGPGPGQFSLPVEFFDGEGNQFTGAYDGQGNLVALTATADPPDLTAFLQRLQNILDVVWSYVENNPAGIVDDPPGSRAALQVALAEFLQLGTLAALSRPLQLLVAGRSDDINAMEAAGQLDPGSFGHNALHAAGRGH
ncbi:MAG: hypothetical protein ACT4NY_16510 [Pseudonocardiales bacterium]